MVEHTSQVDVCGVVCLNERKDSKTRGYVTGFEKRRDFTRKKEEEVHGSVRSELSRGRYFEKDESGE